MIGLADGLAELPGIDLRVEPVVILGMTQENEVVDGDYALDAALTDTDGQFARETMEHFHAVAPQLGNNPPRAPEGLAKRRAIRITETNIRQLGYLAAQILTTRIGGIEAQVEVAASQIVDKRAAIAAKSCAVPDDSLGIEADGHPIAHERLKCLKTKRTITKLAGTAMASTAIGASSRLRPIHRKKLKSTMWSR